MSQKAGLMMNLMIVNQKFLIINDHISIYNFYIKIYIYYMISDYNREI